MRLPFVTLLMLLMGSDGSVTKAQPAGFMERTLSIGAKAYPYIVYVPEGFSRRRKWPTVLFLHGAGERGSDGSHIRYSLGKAIRENPKRFPMVVVFPQVPVEERWLGEPADAAMQALDATMAEFSGDSRRVYLTGLSMGGYGTWHLAMANPGRFAAIVPICGGLLPHDSAPSVQTSPLLSGVKDPYASAARALRRVPVWIFHGSADPVIPVSESRLMSGALESVGAEVHYTEYPRVGHNSWDRAYADRAMWKWLLAKRRER